MNKKMEEGEEGGMGNVEQRGRENLKKDVV